MLKYVKIVVSCLLLGALLWSADWADVRQKLSHAHVEWLLPAMLLLALQFPISSYKWGRSLAIHGLRFRFLFLQKVLCIAFFFNNFLPTSIGGDAYRVVRTLPEEGLRSRAVSAVLLERLLGFAALLLIGFICAVISYEDYETSLVGAYATVVGLGAASALLLFLAGRVSWVKRVLSHRKLKFLVENARLIFSDRRGLLIVGAVSFGFQLLAVGIVYILFRAFGESPPFTTCALVAAVSGIAAVLPISINGLGVTEGAFVYTATELGLAFDPAVMVAFALRVLVIPLSLICGLVYMFEGKKGGKEKIEYREIAAASRAAGEVSHRRPAKVSNPERRGNAGGRFHVLLLNYEYPPVGGGGGVASRDLAEALVEEGHRVTVVSSAFEGLPLVENSGGVRIIRVPVLLRTKQDTASHISMLSFVPSAYLAVDRMPARRTVDVINTHFAVPTGPAGVAVARRLRRANVLSIHGGDIFDPSKALSPHRTPLLWRTVRTMLKTADAVVAQSSDTLKNARSYYRIERPIEVIPLGLKPYRLPEKKREDLGLPRNATVLCTIGRLVRRKNINELLEVLGRLVKTAAFFLVVIGDGPELEGLRSKAEALGLAPYVRFCGRVSEELKYAYLCNADIYVSTALHEGFGIVFLEALYCGLPIVCYDRGGQTDFLQDGETGFVVPLHAAGRFEQAVRSLASDPQLRRRIGEQNRKRVQAFTIRACARRYAELFEDCIHRSVRRKRAP